MTVLFCYVKYPREPAEFFDSIMRVVCALANVILRTHPLRAREHVSVNGGSVS